MGHPSKRATNIAMTHKESNSKAEKAKKLTKALAGLADGTYVDLRKAVKATGAVRTTLQRRVDGSQTRREANHHRQQLSPDEEHALVKWVTYLSCTGHPVHHP